MMVVCRAAWVQGLLGSREALVAREGGKGGRGEGGG